MVAIHALYTRLANFDLSNFNYRAQGNVSREEIVDPAVRKRIRTRAIADLVILFVLAVISTQFFALSCKSFKLELYYLFIPVPQFVIVAVGVVAMRKRMPKLMIPVMLYCALLYFVFFYGIFLFGYFLLSIAFVHYIGGHLELPSVPLCVGFMFACAALAAWSAHAAMSFWSLRDDMEAENKEKSRVVENV